MQLISQSLRDLAPSSWSCCCSSAWVVPGSQVRVVLPERGPRCVHARRVYMSMILDQTAVLLQPFKLYLCACFVTLEQVFLYHFRSNRKIRLILHCSSEASKASGSEQRYMYQRRASGPSMTTFILFHHASRTPTFSCVFFQYCPWGLCGKKALHHRSCAVRPTRYLICAPRAFATVRGYSFAVSERRVSRGAVECAALCCRNRQARSGPCAPAARR